MLRLSIARLAGTSLLLLPPLAAPAKAQAAPVPSGSYLDSCKGVTFDAATTTLRANCISDDEGGQFEIGTAPLNTSNCAEGQIWNDNGQLHCLAAKPWGKDNAIPPGSYIQTCSSKSVMNNVLMAKCGAPGGSAYQTRLNLNECQWGGDISNDRGSLRCQPLSFVTPILAVPSGSTAGTPIIMPVRVAPIAKPVKIVPVAPANTSDGAREEKAPKKKRSRHEREERG